MVRPLRPSSAALAVAALQRYGETAETSAGLGSVWPLHKLPPPPASLPPRTYLVLLSNLLLRLRSRRGRGPHQPKITGNASVSATSSNGDGTPFRRHHERHLSTRLSGTLTSSRRRHSKSRSFVTADLVTIEFGVDRSLASLDALRRASRPAELTGYRLEAATSRELRSQHGAELVGAEQDGDDIAVSPHSTTRWSLSSTTTSTRA